VSHGGATGTPFNAALEELELHPDSGFPKYQRLKMEHQARGRQHQSTEQAETVLVLLQGDDILLDIGVVGARALEDREGELRFVVLDKQQV
jgi:hypothetical protein